MHIHILGICGTFMGGIALLAREAGHRVTGCDANVYPPMSTQLEKLGIDLIEGYDPAQTSLAPDLFVIGNAVSRGNPLLEAILDLGLPYTSGPQWLAENVLQGRWVLAVAGTHGKTTTSSMLAWILEWAGLAPGFLIGGVPVDFGMSARLADAPFFVIEADEYDTAFCDKRSKFVHYRPRTLILNNLEFDHADIFPDLAAIETQFHHLVRTVPAAGRIIVNAAEPALMSVLQRGCWSEVERFNDAAHWQASQGGSAEEWQVSVEGGEPLRGSMAMTGRHNRLNALAALLAARHVGVPPAQAIAAMADFKGVRRRMELRGRVADIAVYDDFAHHPTAIALTLESLRRSERNGRILALLEPRSNTMKLGTMKALLPDSLQFADQVYCYTSGLSWDAGEIFAGMDNVRCSDDLAALADAVAAEARTGDHILVMSNGGFGNVHELLLTLLRRRFPREDR